MARTAMISRVIIRLSVLAILWPALAGSAVVAQERDPADRSNMDLGATPQPGPDQHRGDKERQKEPNAQPTPRRRRTGSQSSFSHD
jgi:hypothetical protein